MSELCSGRPHDAVYHNDTNAWVVPCSSNYALFNHLGWATTTTHHRHYHHHSHNAFTPHLTVATFSYPASLQPSHSFTVEMLFNTLLVFTLTFLCGTSIAIPIVDQWRDTRNVFCDPGRDAGSFACSWNLYDIVSSYGYVVVLHHHANKRHLRLLAVPREW